MRLGDKKLICMRRSRISKKSASAFFFTLLVLFIAFICVFYFLKTIRPVMTELAKSKAGFNASKVINTSVYEIFKNDPIKYSDIVYLERDETGKICAVQTDLAALNNLKSVIALNIQQKIAELSRSELVVPLGSLTGQQLFAGVGPDIKIKLLPFGDTFVDFISDFESVGVNQSRLSVSLKVKTQIGLLLPTVNTAVKVEDTLPVFQTVVVGEVPESFFNVPGSDNELLDKALDLVP